MYIQNSLDGDTDFRDINCKFTEVLAIAWITFFRESNKKNKKICILGNSTSGTVEEKDDQGTEKLQPGTGKKSGQAGLQKSSEKRISRKGMGLECQNTQKKRV